MRFSLQSFVEASTRSGRRYARTAEGAEVVNVGITTGEETVIAATSKRARDAVEGGRDQFPVRPGRGVILIKIDRRRQGDRRDRVVGRSRSADRGNHARQRADDQHDEVRSHRPRRQGQGADAARRLHARRAE
jgi:hypothetical protein